jgi:hypothetical protein
MDNMIDRESRGRNRPPRGEDNVFAKLTDDIVIRIRQDRPTHTLKELSERYGVTISVISLVAKRKAWKHVP